MGIRVQPAAIEGTGTRPFRERPARTRGTRKVLTNLLRSIEGPCVLAVDGAWGVEKTTFLNILSAHLRSHDFRVVEFNAWETDFADDPFLALSQELTAGLRDNAPASLQGRLEEVKNAAKEVLRRALPGTIRVATAGILDVAPFVEKETGQALAAYAQSKLDNYLEARKSLLAFKTLLEELAARASKSQQRPAVGRRHRRVGQVPTLLRGRTSRDGQASLHRGSRSICARSESLGAGAFHLCRVRQRI